MTGTSEAAHGAASTENESYCDISLVRKKSVYRVNPEDLKLDHS